MSQSNRVRLLYSKEAVVGEDPTAVPPQMKELRFTSESLDYKKETVVSDVIRADRMTDSIIPVGFTAGGDINVEFAIGQFEDFLEGLLCGTFATMNVTGGMSLVAATKKLTKAGANFNAKIKPGMNVRLSAWANASNNGIFNVSAVTADEVTFANGAFVDEANTVGAKLDLNCLRNGTEQKSFFIQRSYDDLANVYIGFIGMRVDKFTLNLAAKQKVTGTFSFVGMDAMTDAETFAAGIDAVAPTLPLSASANVGNIMRNGAKMTEAMKTLTLAVGNGITPSDQIGSMAAAELNDGEFSTTGTLEAYFKTLALYNAMKDHESGSIEFTLTDKVQGKSMVVTIPNLYFMEGNPAAGGKNQQVTLPLSFTAVRQATYDMQMQIDIL